MKNKHLVKLPDGNYVNPRHVTSVELIEYTKPDRPFTHVWVKKDAGYGTGRYEFAGDRRDELAALLNSQPDDMRAAAL